jgi:hypothetical protein
VIATPKAKHETVPIYVIPEETFLAHRAAVLPKLSSQGAFGGIHPRQGVSREDFKLACADAIVAFQLSRLRERAVTARLPTWEERAYRRIAGIEIPEGSPRSPIRKAILAFLEERDRLFERRKRSRLARLPPMTPGEFQFLIVDLFGLYRCLANPRRPNSETFFSYNLPRMLKVAMPMHEPQEAGSLWKQVTRAGGVDTADVIGRTRISCYPRLRRFTSLEFRAKRRYRRRTGRPASRRTS